MTVNELIRELQKHDKDSLVVVSGYEDGVTAKFRINQVHIKPYSNPKDYYGEYEIAIDGKNAVAIER